MRGTSNLSENVCVTCSGTPLASAEPLCSRKAVIRAMAPDFNLTSASRKIKTVCEASRESTSQACCFPHQPGGRGGAVSMRTRRSELAIARTMHWSWGLGSCDSAGRGRAASEWLRHSFINRRNSLQLPKPLVYHSLQGFGPFRCVGVFYKISLKHQNTKNYLDPYHSLPQAT